MFCHPYHQTCHPASFRGHPFDMLDDMFDLAPQPSSCHSAYMNGQRTMERRHREQAIRQQQAGRRARLPKKERAKPFQVSVIEDSDDALVVSLRLVNKCLSQSQLKIEPNGRSSLRVSMTAHRPVHHRVEDMWGRQRLVQTGVEKHKLFSETLNFKTDVPLLVKNVQARAISDDMVIVTIPYEQTESAGVADEFEFEVASNGDDDAEETPQIEEEDEKDDDVSEEGCTEVTAALTPDVDAASEDSFEIPIDGTIEDCDLDE